MTTQENHFPGLGVLIIDMQEGFLKAIADADVITQRVAFVAQCAKLFSIPVYVTEQVPDKLGSTIEPIQSKLPEGSTVYPKTAFSAWAAEGLQEQLDKDGIQHLLIVGIETSICVYQSLLDIANESINCTLLSDAIACRRKEDGETVLNAIRDAGNLILPSETVFFSMIADAKHPLFRDYSKLVKQYA